MGADTKLRLICRRFTLEAKRNLFLDHISHHKYFFQKVSLAQQDIISCSTFITQNNFVLILFLSLRKYEDDDATKYVNYAVLNLNTNNIHFRRMHPHLTSSNCVFHIWLWIRHWRIDFSFGSLPLERLVYPPIGVIYTNVNITGVVFHSS